MASDRLALQIERMVTRVKDLTLRRAARASVNTVTSHNGSTLTVEWVGGTGDNVLLIGSHGSTWALPITADTGWLPLQDVVTAWGSGVSVYSGGTQWNPYIRKIGNEVIFRGLITASSVAANGLLFRLPAEYRPGTLDRNPGHQGHHFAAGTGMNTYVTIRAESGGDVDLGAVATTSNTWLSLDNLRWRTDTV